MNEQNCDIQSSLEDEKTASNKVTLLEIKDVLKENNIDVFKTNACAIRKITGHGGQNTIQKHLTTLRLEVRPPPVVLLGSIPSAPGDVVKALWEAAYTAVQLQVLAKIESLTAQRDQATELMKAQMCDIDSFANEVDELSAQICTFHQDQKKQGADFAEQLNEFEKEREGWTHRLGESQAEIDFIRSENKISLSDARHAAELAVRDAAIREQTLQSTINNLLNQVADLKSVLIERGTFVSQLSAS